MVGNLGSWRRGELPEMADRSRLFREEAKVMKLGLPSEPSPKERDRHGRRGRQKPTRRRRADDGWHAAQTFAACNQDKMRMNEAAAATESPIRSTGAAHGPHL